MKNLILTLALLVSVSTVSAQNWAQKKQKEMAVSLPKTEPLMHSTS